MLGRPGTPPPAAILGILDRFGYERLRETVGNLYDELRSAGQSTPSLPVPEVPTLEEAEFLPALAALDELSQALPISLGEVKQGLTSVRLPGRLQVLPGRPATVSWAKALRDSSETTPVKVTAPCLDSILISSPWR